MCTEWDLYTNWEWKPYQRVCRSCLWAEGDLVTMDSVSADQSVMSVKHRIDQWPRLMAACVGSAPCRPAGPWGLQGLRTFNYQQLSDQWPSPDHQNMHDKGTQWEECVCAGYISDGAPWRTGEVYSHIHTNTQNYCMTFCCCYRSRIVWIFFYLTIT